MLTADLVSARRRGDELVLSRLRGQQRARAVELAAALLDAARASVGSTRDELTELWRRIDTLARERRLVEGLTKLLEDACEFEADASLDPPALRQEVFARASETHRSLRDGETFDREQVLAEVAAARGLEPRQIEQALYADLRGAHLLAAVAPLEAEQLVGRYEQAQTQAVLLRAVEVTAVVECRTPAAYRTLFHQLKFRRLLYQIEQLGSGYRLKIDGPLSLFESVTKYGLQLALAFPALEACDRLELEARVRWGKQRRPLLFRHTCRRGRGRERTAESGVPVCDDPPLPAEVVALREAFEKLETGWSVSVSDRILHLPTGGLCVPDLVFLHPDRPSPIYLEVLGYWSREAVWKRVELVQQGLGERILFAVSSRLRVSEQVLDDHESGALYVYKGAMSARAIARRLDAWH